VRWFLPSRAAAPAKEDFLHRSGCGKTLRICRRVAQDLRRVIPENDLVTIGTEEEEPADLREINPVRAKLHVMPVDGPAEIVPELVLANQSLLGNVNVPQETLIRKYQFRDDFSWTVNRHTKIGRAHV